MHFWRENGRDYAWHGPGPVIAPYCTSNASLVATGSTEGSDRKTLYALNAKDGPREDAGFDYRRRWVNTLLWDPRTTNYTPTPFVGLCLMFSTIGQEEVGYDDGSPGWRYMAGVTSDGRLALGWHGMPANSYGSNSNVELAMGGADLWRGRETAGRRENLSRAPNPIQDSI